MFNYLNFYAVCNSKDGGLTIVQRMYAIRQQQTFLLNFRTTNE
jgi:hypothetical protein